MDPPDKTKMIAFRIKMQARNNEQKTGLTAREVICVLFLLLREVIGLRLIALSGNLVEFRYS